MLPHNAGMPDPASNPTPPTSAATARRTMMPATTPVAGRVGPPSGAGARPLSPGRPPGLSTAPDMGRLFRAFQRRWVMAFALGITLAGLAGAGAWNLLAPKQTAYSSIRVSSRVQSPINPSEDDRYRFNLFLRSQAAQIKSRFVLNAALLRDEIKRLNLQKKYTDAVAWLETELKVETGMDSEIVRLSLSSDDPEEARLVVNAVAQAYMKEVVEKEDSARAARVADLDKIYAQATAKLRDKMNSYKKQAKEIGSIEDPTVQLKYQDLLSRSNDARTRLTTTTFELLRARSLWEAHKVAQKELANLPLPEAELNLAVETDPTLKADNAEVRKMRERVDEIKSGYEKPEQELRYALVLSKLIEAEKRVTTRRTELRKELEVRFREKAKADWEARGNQLQGQLALLITQKETLEHTSEVLSKEIEKYTNNSGELTALAAEIKRDEQSIARVDVRLKEAGDALLAKPRVSIYDEAAVAPVERKKQFMGTAAAAVISLGGVCFGVSLWEFRRRRVHSSDEVSTGLGIRVVGAVPASAYVERMINAPADEAESDPLLTESIDAIRTQLLAEQADPARVLLVTSAGPGEGKTTLAAHLASSLARAGRKTLLIDGDLRQPSVHQFFEAALQPGFSEVLLSEVHTADALLATNVDGLLVLPAGQWDREVLASLARGGAQGVFEKLKNDFDFIVVDSHPVLSANDSLLIGQHVDAVILAVLREVSHTPKIYAAAQRLSGLGIRVLGAVVNAADPDEVYSSASTPNYATTVA